MSTSLRDTRGALLRSGEPGQHHRIWLILLILLLLLVLGAQALGVQLQPRRLTSQEVRMAADASGQLRVVVSIDRRRLWVLDAAGDTLRTSLIAVGSGRQLLAAGRSWRFATPVGVRAVVSTEIDPVWIRPDWAFVELARQRKLRVDSVGPSRPRPLGGSDSLVVRGRSIGIVRGTSFESWPVDRDIVIGRVLYVPPPGSPYREVRGVLGRYRLNLGASIGFHGTLDTASVGRAATHGCMRLLDPDIEWLYLHVPIGTPVFIY